jgi:ABC-type dipeptide/oligopeptide/nickel transport system permease subunit
VFLDVWRNADRSRLKLFGLGNYRVEKWGGIIQYAFARNGIINNFWWWYIPPIFCISLCVLGFMLLGYHSPSSQINKKHIKLQLRNPLIDRGKAGA